MKNQIWKNKKGITLIALIITIIILLILAGISIATLTGDNGILIKANHSKEESEKAKAEEEMKLVLNEWKIEKNLTNKTFIEFLDTKVESNEIDKYIPIGEEKNEIYRGGYVIVVDAKGDIVEKIQQVERKPKIKNIKITLEDGTEPEDYSQENGTVLIVNFEASIEGGKITKIEPEIPYRTDGKEMEKTFKITGQIDGVEYTKNITISFEKKYKLREPEITRSTKEWTNQNVTVEVNYGNIDETYTKEISIDGGTTYQIYTGPVEIEKNTIVKARIRGEVEVESELEISNIDKIPPNKFTPTVTENVSSTEITVNAKTTDKQDETGEFGCSGMKEYQYFVYQGPELVTKSEITESTSWVAQNLTVGSLYDYYVEAYDKAGNKVESERKNGVEKLQIYVWEKFVTNSSTSYAISTTNNISVTVKAGLYYPVYSNNYNSSTGVFTSTGQVMPCNGYGYYTPGFETYTIWFINKGVANNPTNYIDTAKEIFYVEHGKGTLQGGGTTNDREGSVIFSNAKKKASYLVTNYSNSGQSKGFVTSINSNEYPDNNHKTVVENGKNVVYWFVKKP